MLDCFKNANNTFQNVMAKAIQKNNATIAKIEEKNNVFEGARDTIAQLLDKAWDVADAFAYEADDNHFSYHNQGIATANQLYVTLAYGSYKVELTFELDVGKNDIGVFMRVSDEDDGAIFEGDWFLDSGPEFETFLWDGFDALAGVLNEEM